MILPTLYKLDSRGNIREWVIEVEEDRFRSVSGLKDGKKVVTNWTIATSKNVGHCNETTGQQQALLEAEALHKKKKDKGWSETNQTSVEPFFKPMLAHKFEAKLLRQTMFSQPKLDGIRCIAKSDGLWTRNGKKIISCPHIEAALKPFFAKEDSLILDGELYNHDLRNDFNQIVGSVKRLKPTQEDLNLSAKLIEYHVYDAPSSQLFSKRVALLASLQHYLPDCIKLVQTSIVTVSGADSCYESYLVDGYEGQIIRLDTPYENKRSKSLLKRKEFQDAEYEIVDIEEGLGNWSGMAKSLLCKLPDGRTFGSGLKGDAEFARALLQDRKEYLGKSATIRYFALTPDGIPRFPVAYALHKDKRW